MRDEEEKLEDNEGASEEDTEEEAIEIAEWFLKAASSSASVGGKSPNGFGETGTTEDIRDEIEDVEFVEAESAEESYDFGAVGFCWDREG